jgi:hypothetical protein
MTNLNQSYVDYSVGLVKKFMPAYSSIEWIFGKAYDKKNKKMAAENFGGIENTSPENKQEVANNPAFYSFIKGDLLASYYMTSLSLSPWTNSALDVLLRYWAKKMTYADCIWNLNRRLWPLINAMNEASPNVYMPKKALDGIKKNHPKYITALNDWGLYPTPNPVESRDFYQGLAFSQFDENKNIVAIDESWEHTNDDVMFAHRDNVLRLLFKFDEIDEILNPSLPKALSPIRVEMLIRSIAPAYVLSAHQHEANNTLRREQDPSLGPENAKESDFIMNSLCSSVAVSEATAGTLYRPYGRDRFETNNSFIMQAGVGSGYTGRVMGDDKVGANLYSYTTKTWGSVFLGTHDGNWESGTYDYYQGTTFKKTIDISFPKLKNKETFNRQLPTIGLQLGFNMPW